MLKKQQKHSVSKKTLKWIGFYSYMIQDDFIQDYDSNRGIGIAAAVEGC